MIEALNLNKIPDIRHGFFTREGGYSQGLYGGLNCSFSSGDEPENVARNRDHIATALGVAADRLAVPHQVHSRDAVVVTEPWSRAMAPQVDGLVTAQRDVALGVTTADCAPVLFADRDAGVIGAAHAGWRGALGGVTDATVAAMEEIGASRSNICAAVGPTISRPAYEVGSELRDVFLSSNAETSRFFGPSEREGHYMFDLPAYLEWRLIRDGVGSVERSGLCTYGDEQRFFSYRRATHRNEKIYGCQLSAITLGPASFLKESS
jgi:hypothetical protein